MIGIGPHIKCNSADSNWAAHHSLDCNQNLDKTLIGKEKHICLVNTMKMPFELSRSFYHILYHKVSLQQINENILSRWY